MNNKFKFITLLFFIIFGLTFYLIKNINSHKIQKLSETSLSEERKIYLISREFIRRSLKNPADAKFYSPYRNITVVSNQVVDIPDTNEVASVLHKDYWISEGLVDAYAKIGNKEREKWVVILDTNLVFVYLKFDGEIEGEYPLMSKEQKLKIEELKRQEEELERQKIIQEQKLKEQKKKQKLESEERKRLENEEKIRSDKEKKKRDLEERVRKFRESRGQINN